MSITLKKQLEEKIAKLNELIAEISKTISTIESQRDIQINQIRETFKQIINRKKTLNDLIENLELSMVNKDNQILIKQLQVELNSLKQQVSTEVSDLQTYDNEIHLYEQTIMTRTDELTKQNALVKQVQIEEKNLSKIFQELNTQTEKISANIEILEKKVEELQKDLQKSKHELETQKVELEDFFQSAKKVSSQRPEIIHIQTLLKEREQILLKEKTNLINEGVSKEDLDHYEMHKTAVNDLKRRLYDAKEEYTQLKSSLEHWHTKWDRVFNIRITKAQQMYQDILSSISTKGRIEIVDPLNLEYGQASFYEQFPNEE